MAHFQVPWVSLLYRFDYISQFMKIFRHSQNANCDFSTFLTMQIYWMFCLLCIKIQIVEVYSIQHYMIKFVSNLRQVGGFLWYSCFLHQVAESTITPTRSGPLPECFGCYVYRFKLIMLSYSTDQIVSK